MPLTRTVILLCLGLLTVHGVAAQVTQPERQQQTTATTQPTVDHILEVYVRAVGGKAAVGKIRSS